MVVLSLLKYYHRNLDAKIPRIETMTLTLRESTLLNNSIVFKPKIKLSNG